MSILANTAITTGLKTLAQLGVSQQISVPLRNKMTMNMANFIKRRVERIRENPPLRKFKYGLQRESEKRRPSWFIEEQKKLNKQISETRKSTHSWLDDQSMITDDSLGEYLGVNIKKEKDIRKIINET